MRLEDIRDYVSGMGIAEDEHCYMGKLDGKEPYSIGSYHRRRAGPPKIPLGGMGNASYEMFPATFLVHWNKSPRETEQAARELYGRMRGCRNETVNERRILFISMQVPEPQDIGTDENGICEMVVEADFYYERSDKL